MKKKRNLLLTALLLALLVTGCSTKNTESESKTETETSSKETSVVSSSETSVDNSDNDEQEKIFRWSSMSSGTNISPYEGNTEIVDYIHANLYRYVPNETKDGTKLTTDLAASEPVTTDGYTWNIKIDPNAKWANGDLINADTFMYSWQKALDPITMFSTASGLAQNIIKVKNAYEYYTQEAKDVEVAWEDVGFKKVDDYTVSITTTEKYTAAQVMQHFQMRYTGAVYQPIYEACMSSDGTSTTYGTEAELFMASGPFVLTSWTKGTERVFVKNENYVHADEIKLDGMYVREVADEATQLQLYQNGEIDFLELGTNGYQAYGDDPRTISYDSTTIRDIEINFENPDKPYLKNLNFRRALYYAIDRDTVAKLSNYIGAAYFLPAIYTVSVDGTSIRDLEGGMDYLPENNGYNKELALDYFNKALQELGIDKVDLALIYNEAVPATRSASEYIQSSLTEIFGADHFNLSITAMNNAEAVKLMRTSQNGPTNGWDLCWGGWDLTAAVYSANKKFEVYRTIDARRFTQYQNTEIDNLFSLSISEEYRLDEKKLGEVTLAMEKSLIEDVGCIPVFQQVSYYIFSDRIQLPLQTRVRILGFGYQYIDIK